MKKSALALARVSTDEQKEANNSLPAQERRLVDYFNKLGIKIEKIYSFDESAYKINRKEFSLVIESLKSRNDDTVLCIGCDKIDRLIRNFTGDLVTLEELRKAGKIELHFPSDNIVLHKDSPAADLFRFTIGVSLAKYYSDSISDNVKRTFEQKLHRGENIGKARYGYKNITLENKTKTLILDEFQSQIVIKIYDWYASGAYSMRLIKEKLKEDYDIKLANTKMEAILKDTFYYGMQKVKRKLYPHKYDTLISKELFDKVQDMKFNRWKAKGKFKYKGKPYLYRGLIRCAQCGYAITPETHKNHAYYHCTQYGGKHNAVWVREEKITEQLGTFFKSIQIPIEAVEEIVQTLKSVHQGKSELREAFLKKLFTDKERYQKQLDNLYLDKLSGSITEEKYNQFYARIREQLSRVDASIIQQQKTEDEYHITANYLLDLANRAYELFVGSEVEERRQLLTFVLQNLRLDNGLLRYDLLNPFDTLANFTDHPVMGG